MGFETQDVERKLISILKILSDADSPVGSKIIARRLNDCGIELGERAVRYHLKLMDERGLTQLVGRRDGRVLTERGIEEAKYALVKDRVGFAISKIQLLAFRTNFDLEKGCGTIPVNVSFFAKDELSQAIQAMKPAFEEGFCASDLVAVAPAGERLGEVIVPREQVGLATVCSIAINGCLLKAGVPMDSRFGGVLQIRNGKPLRFVELIHYAGCSMDPSEIFIRARMTSVWQAAMRGEGKVLAGFREMPAICRPIAEEVVVKLEGVGLGAPLLMGNTSEVVCEVPVELNKIGMILIGGLNPEV